MKYDFYHIMQRITKVYAMFLTLISKLIKIFSMFDVKCN